MADHDEIAQLIEAALAGRRKRRADVEDLCGALEALQGGFADLVHAVDAVGDNAGTRGDGTESVQEGIRTIFDEGPFGRRFTAAVLADLSAVRQQAKIIRRRVERETVNLGVVGMMKAGKSTLLRSITGLDESVILPRSWAPPPPP